MYLPKAIHGCDPWEYHVQPTSNLACLAEPFQSEIVNKEKNFVTWSSGFKYATIPSGPQRKSLETKDLPGSKSPSPTHISTDLLQEPPAHIFSNNEKSTEYFKSPPYPLHVVTLIPPQYSSSHRTPHLSPSSSSWHCLISNILSHYFFRHWHLTHPLVHRHIAAHQSGINLRTSSQAFFGISFPKAQNKTDRHIRSNHLRFPQQVRGLSLRLPRLRSAWEPLEEFCVLVRPRYTHFGSYKKYKSKVQSARKNELGFIIRYVVQITEYRYLNTTDIYISPTPKKPRKFFVSNPKSSQPTPLFVPSTTEKNILFHPPATHPPKRKNERPSHITNPYNLLINILPIFPVRPLDHLLQRTNIRPSTPRTTSAAALLKSRRNLPVSKRFQSRRRGR